LIHYTLDDLPLLTPVYANPRQRHLADAEIDQAAAKLAQDVVVLLRDGGLKDLQFTLVKADPRVELAGTGILLFRVRQ
jgi:hypothetical protein